MSLSSSARLPFRKWQWSVAALAGILLLSTALALWYRTIHLSPHVQTLPLTYSTGPTDYTPNMSLVFSSSYFDIFPNHNEYLDVFDTLVRDNKLTQTPKVLIQVDYHADMFRNNFHIDQGTESIANWINVLASENYPNGQPVLSDIYWVLPDTTMLPGQKDEYWSHTTTEDSVVFRDGPADETTYADAKTGRLYFTTPPSGVTLRKILFHKRLLHDLPSFANSPQEVLLSIDMDYFISNGLEVGNVPYRQTATPDELDRQLTDFVGTLDAKGIHPVLTACSRSPGYVVAGDEPILEKFCNTIASYSKTGALYPVLYVHTQPYFTK